MTRLQPAGQAHNRVLECAPRRPHLSKVMGVRVEYTMRYDSS